MPEQYRLPREVRDGTDLPASMTLADVLALRGAPGPAGTWADGIAADLARRATEIEEAVVAATQTRAEGADIPLADALAYLLNDVFAFYARAHESHWNVSGPDFAEYHALFGEIYEDAHGSIDGIAENIRKVGSLAPCLHVMPDESRDSNAQVLAAALLAENDELLVQIRAAFDIATAAGQQGIANFLAERQDAHAKWGWQLRSSLGVAEVGEPVAEDAGDMDDPAGDVEENSADPEVEARRSLIDAAEKRTFVAEVRAEKSDDGTVRMTGYPAMWDKEADGLPFREVIKRGAFAQSLDRGDDVFLLVNHDTDQLPLARRSAGTLELSEDETGLRMDATLDPRNPRAAELASALERGDVDKMSFAFRVAENGSVKNDDGVRELRALDLFEVSVVTWPAYSSTSVGLRSADDDDLPLRWKRAALRLRQQSL